MSINKKGQAGEIMGILFILLLLVPPIVIIFSILEQVDELDKCKNGCPDYGAKFVKYEPSNQKNAGCYCRREQESLKIW